jgi:2-methylcitrate dehydratase
VKEQSGYQGGLNNPLSWDRTVEDSTGWLRFFADEDLRGRLKDAVQLLDRTMISNLMDLLAQVRPAPSFPKIHAGIQ